MLCRRILLVLLLVLPLVSAGRRVRTVVIDPGHGGTDPGAVWGKTYEKDIVLDVAKMLGQMMKEQMPGVNVIYTRTTDVKVDLTKRAKTANDADADLFVSVHVNATSAKEGPSGALTLVMGQDKEEKNLDMMATKENDVIFSEEDYETTYKEYLSGSNEMFILYSVLQYANIDKSIRFASMMQKQFKTSTPMPDKGINQHPALVLWYATMPGALVELGFINNAHDRGVLTSESGKRKVAAAILAAVAEYFGESISMAVKPAETTTGTPTVKPVEKKVEKRDVRDGKFAIQILSTTRKVPKGSGELKGYKPTEKYRGGRYRYYLGPYATRAEAQAELQAVRRSFRDAFITTVE